MGEAQLTAKKCANNENDSNNNKKCGNDDKRKKIRELDTKQFSDKNVTAKPYCKTALTATKQRGVDNLGAWKKGGG